MYQEYLINDNISEINLKEIWRLKIDSLLRVPFFDPENSDFVYIVCYSERYREYQLKKFLCESGQIIWEKKFLNGGYGTPVIYGRTVFMLSGFDTIVGVDKETGELEFEISLGSRVRTSLNVFENLVWVAGVEDIVGVDQRGNIQKKFKLSGAFIYGVLLSFQDMVLVTGTKYFEEQNKSYKVVWLLNFENGEVLFEIKLDVGSIISTDTSGAWISENHAYISNNNIVYKVNLINGEIEWSSEVEGDCDRQTVVVEKNRVYYTTLKGVVGCLQVEDGKKVWDIKMKEGLIVSPVSIIGDTLFVLADAMLYELDKISGTLKNRQVIGHTPYSMCSVFGNYVAVGGGEPPSHGLLTMFQIEEELSIPEVLDYFTLDNDFDNDYIEISIKTLNKWEKVSVHTSRISEIEIQTLNGGPQSFSGKIKLSERNVEGLYAIPLTLTNHEATEKYVSIAIELKRTKTLPTKKVISKFLDPVTQSTEFNSGAALSVMMLEKYGKLISQEEFRKIVDYVKEKSNWGDAEFQTWRLVLKRILTNSSITLGDFKKSEEEI